MVGGLTLQHVYRARERLGALVERTPLVESPELSKVAGGDVHLKLENQQLTGSFKVRGALNAVLALNDEERRRGVVTVSTGNHGRGVAFACRRAGVRVVVCMSRLVPANKLQAIEDLGAEVRIVGRGQDEAQLEAERLVAEEGLVLLPPFDHGEVIAGQGTIALEIVERLPPVAQVLVPLSGGGLVSGVALALKSINPAIRVVGVGMAEGCAMYRSLEAGKPVDVEEPESLADSLGGGIGLDNRYTFALVRELVDEVVLVEEEQVARAIVHAYRHERQIVEGAGAVGIAALLYQQEALSRRRDGPSVVLVSGANIDMELHRRLISDGEQGPTTGGGE